MLVGRSIARARPVASRIVPLCARSTPKLLPRHFATTPVHSQETAEPAIPRQNIEGYVRSVREEWGEYLPEGLLSPDEFAVYERYYGSPVRILKKGEELEKFDDEAEDLEDSIVTLEDAQGVEVELDGSAMAFRSEKEAKAYKQLAKDIEAAEEVEEVEDAISDEYYEDDEEEGPTVRIHPLTQVGKFQSYPKTIIPPDALTEPTNALLSDVNNRHLGEATTKILGDKMNHSPIFTYKSSKSYNGIPLNPSSTLMSDMQSSVFLSTVLPGYYAQCLSALAELRRRLGGDWVLGREGEAEGVKNVLDVGAGGAGVLAWRSIIAAEQARRKDEKEDLDGVEIPEPDFIPHEETASPAGLKATVVTGSEPLRYRMSKFLDNTTFLPRIPEVPNNEAAVPGQLKQPRKLYDLIIANNTIIPLFENHKRKDHIQNLWSLLNPNGGVLLLIEKGSPYGFEAIAGARASLLKYNIASEGNVMHPLIPGEDIEAPRNPKETASIIAPCTNHEECPMFISGPSRVGRKDYCRFSQRYQRPSYMQRIIKATARDHEDLEYSYVAVRRGVDVRQAPSINPSTEEFDTSKHPPRSPYSMRQLREHSFTLPRAVFPPMKRRGHVILDVCTPTGKIERWTVPKSYGKTAFRDARKSRWGDLWALGAKTKISRNLKLGGKGEAPRTKITRVTDLEKGDVVENVREVDRKGGKKKNIGKRQRERREVKERGRKRLQESDREDLD